MTPPDPGTPNPITRPRLPGTSTPTPRRPDPPPPPGHPDAHTPNPPTWAPPTPTPSRAFVDSRRGPAPASARHADADTPSGPATALRVGVVRAGGERAAEPSPPFATCRAPPRPTWAWSSWNSRFGFWSFVGARSGRVRKPTCGASVVDGDQQRGMLGGEPSGESGAIREGRWIRRSGQVWSISSAYGTVGRGVGWSPAPRHSSPGCGSIRCGKGRRRPRSRAGCSGRGCRCEGRPAGRCRCARRPSAPPPSSSRRRARPGTR